MATIRVRGTADTATSSPVRSLLVCLQRSGIRIQTLCGGKAQCGRCMVYVHSGAVSLSAVLPRERERLEAIHAPPGARLACQTYTRGDIEIEIVNPGSHPRGRP